MTVKSKNKWREKSRLLDVDTRVADTLGREDWHASGLALSVLVEADFTFVLDELALADDPQSLAPSTGVALNEYSIPSQALVDSVASLPGVVVGDLAADVVGDVGLGDTVSGGGADPAGDLADDAGSAHEFTIEGGESTTGEGEGRGLVVRKGGVGVLEEGDEDEPVVDPEVRKEIDTEDVQEAPSLDRVSDSSQPDEDANIGDDDVGELMRGEQRGLGREVVREAGVGPLASSVPDEVERPADQKLGGQPKDRDDGGIFKGLREDLLEVKGNLGSFQVLLFGIQRRQATLLAGLGDEDLVASEVRSLGVVLGVRDPPRMIRNTESGMQNPAHGVVGELAGGECLMTAFVGEDPNTSSDKPGAEVVEEPSGTSGDLVKGWVWEVDIFRGDFGDVGRRGPEEDAEPGKVPENIEGRVEEIALIAVLRDGTK